MDETPSTPFSERDPHRYRRAGITRLSVAVLERAMRDAQLVDVGHRVRVCRLEAWPDRERRVLRMIREWLQDAADPMLRLWTSGAGLEVTPFTERVRRCVDWTTQLETGARLWRRPPRRPREWLSVSLLRRVDER